jgi:hypothetical protein
MGKAARTPVPIALPRSAGFANRLLVSRPRSGENTAGGTEGGDDPVCGNVRARAAVSAVASLRYPVAALLVALAPGLIACGGSRNPPPPCPQAAIAQGADTVTVYRPGSERTGADVRYLAVMADAVSACRYEDGRVVVDLALLLVAERGPAYAGPAELTYVVGVVGPGGDLLGREVFTTAIDIPEGSGGAGAIEELTQFIPGVTPREGGAYRVLLGFELSEEEVRRRQAGAATGAPPPGPE